MTLVALAPTLLATLAASPTSVPWTAAPALLDGRCDPAEYAEAATVDLGHDQQALFRRDAERLWVCIPLRPGSLGTMDLAVVTPLEPAPVDLHVSAQVGETTWRDGAWPEIPWWNARGWAAPWVAFDGFDGEGAARRPRFRSSGARELALELARFGEGTWRWRLELRRAVDAQGAAVQTVHPPGSTEDAPDGWATLDTGGRGAAPRPSAAVGVRVVEIVDRSRTAPGSDPPRPAGVAVTVWHPSEGGTRPARVADLAQPGGPTRAEPRVDREAVRSELRRWGSGVVTDAALQAWLDTPVDGTSVDAPLPTGGRPWVVLLSPLPAWGHDALAAAIARSGVVVAHLHSPAVRDIAAVASELPRAFPTIDPNRLGLVAFGGAAPAAVLFAMHHEGLAAFVSVDGAEAWDAPAARLESHPDYRPGRFAPPFLRIAAAGRTSEDRRLFAGATRLAGEEIAIEGLSPSDFFAPLALSSLAARAPLAPGIAGPLPRDPGPVAAGVEARVTRFLAERFGGPPPVDVPLPAGWRRTALEPLPRPAVQHDGRATEAMWSSAVARALAGAGAGRVRVASDAAYLYVSIERDRPGRFSTELVIDPRGAGGESWTSDTWWLHSSNSVCESRGAYGRFDGCGRAVAWSVTETQREPKGDAAEYAIAWRKLGLPGPPESLALGVRLVDERGAAAWPGTLDPSKPSTFGRVEMGTRRPGVSP